MSALSAFLQSGYLAAGADKHLHDFVTKLDESRVPEDFDFTVQEEVTETQRKLSQPDLPPRKTRLYLARMVYCNMLGYDVSFALPAAIKFTQSAQRVEERRIGYMTCVLLAQDNHDLLIMLVNTLVRDLNSQSYLDICAALDTICHLKHMEIQTAVLDACKRAAGANKAIVRKKALLALHNFYRLSKRNAPLDSDDAGDHPAQSTSFFVEHLEEIYRKSLTDIDPSVAACSINLWRDISEMNPPVQAIADLLHKFVERRSGQEFDYHGVCAPWSQIACLQMLGKFAESDVNTEAHELIVEVTKKSVQAASKGVDAAFAIVLQGFVTLHKLNYSFSTILDTPPSPISSLLSIRPELPQSLPYLIDQYLRARNPTLLYLGTCCLEYIPTEHWLEGWKDGGLLSSGLQFCCADSKVMSQILRQIDRVLAIDVVRVVVPNVLATMSIIRKEHIPATCSLALADWIVKAFKAFDNSLSAEQLEWRFQVFVSVMVECGKDIQGDWAEHMCNILAGDLFIPASKGADLLSKEVGSGDVAVDQERVLRTRALQTFCTLCERVELASLFPEELVRLAVKALGTYVDLLPKEGLRILKCLWSLFSINSRDDFLQAEILEQLTACIKVTRQCPTEVKRGVQKLSNSPFPELQKVYRDFMAIANDVEVIDPERPRETNRIPKATRMTASQYVQASQGGVFKRNTLKNKGSTIIFDKSEHDEYQDDAGGRQSSLVSRIPLHNSSSGKHHSSRPLEKPHLDYLSPRSPTSSHSRSPVPSETNDMLSSLLTMELNDRAEQSTTKRGPFSGPSAAFNFAHTLPVTPLDINTAQFGRHWTHLRAERTLYPLLNVETMEELLSQVEQDVGFKVVEIIGKEFIAAGKFGSKESMLLLHMDVSDIHDPTCIVRARRREEVDRIADTLMEYLG